MNRLAALALLLLFAFSGARGQTTQEQIYTARDKVMPALVHIQPVVKNYNTGELEKQEVIGSGIIFHPDGYVVTNYHVAGKSLNILCTLSDKEIVPATYIGGDPSTDIAVIKLDLSQYHGTIHTAEFGDSDSVRVGQYVIAMGSPLSLSRSLSVGVVSTKDRYFGADVRLPTGERTGQYNLWIQTDAAINPGNSGGPLVNLLGQVIGINSRATMFANNIGFAIPVNVVKRVTSDIIQHGNVSRSWIGVHIQALQELEQYFGTNRNSGVLISSIDPGSPADKSFLKAGDVILQVDDTPVSARFVEEVPSFYSLIAEQKPGSEIGLTVLRDGQEFNLKVKTRQLGELQGEDFEVKEWGFTLKGITRQMQIDYKLKDTLGVFVAGVKPVSPADDAGLRSDDVIVKINDTLILHLPDFVMAYNMLIAEETEKVLLTVHRNGATRFVLLNLSRRMGEVYNAN